MPITQAHPSDIRLIQQLITRSRYTYTNFGMEDLSTILTDGIVVMSTENGRPNAYLSIKEDDQTQTRSTRSTANVDRAFRSETAVQNVPLYSDPPHREYVRGVAIERGISPTAKLAQLFDAYSAIVRGSTGAVEVICYSNDGWLVRALTSNGFEIRDRIKFFYLNRLERFAEDLQADLKQKSDLESFQIRALHSNELESLVALDAAAFEPFWHLNKAQLLEVLFRARVRVAIKERKIIGYSALILGNDRAAISAGGTGDYEATASVNAPTNTTAQLARLAVHPQYHGHGFGGKLLAEVIGYVYKLGIQEITLNTQSSNRPSNRLYRSFGFRTTGEILSVLYKRISFSAPNRLDCPHP